MTISATTMATHLPIAQGCLREATELFAKVSEPLPTKPEWWRLWGAPPQPVRPPAELASLANGAALQARMAHRELSALTTSGDAPAGVASLASELEEHVLPKLDGATAHFQAGGSYSPTRKHLTGYVYGRHHTTHLDATTGAVRAAYQAALAIGNGHSNEQAIAAAAPVVRDVIQELTASGMLEPAATGLSDSAHAVVASAARGAVDARSPRGMIAR